MERYLQKIDLLGAELERSGDKSVEDILSMQKTEANTQFFKFVKNNYKDWINGNNAPLFSHNVFRKKVLPLIQKRIPTYFIVIDNLRYDQWKIIEPSILQDFDLLKDDIYYSICQQQHNIPEIPFFLVCYHQKLRKDFQINGRTMKMREGKICLRKISLLINYKD